jgi:hypothetical protein
VPGARGAEDTKSGLGGNVAPAPDRQIDWMRTGAPSLSNAVSVISRNRSSAGKYLPSVT